MTQSKETILAVQQMQDYIAGHINEPITLSDLAKAANYSQSHCSRIFRELTGKLPFEYIRALRLTEAARQLRDNNVKVVDVALDFVFDTHEGFTRAFSKEFGISPYRYKQKPAPLKYFIPYGVLTQNLTKIFGERKMEKKQIIFTQVVERPRRKAIIKRGINATHYYEYCEEAGCDVWGILESIKEAAYEPAGFWLPAKLIKKGTSEYVQGVEVPQTYGGIIPEGFELIELEPCKMMVFQGEPYNDKDFETVIGSIMEAIDSFNPTVYGYTWADTDAPRFQLAPIGERGYIEARPVKSK